MFEDFPKVKFSILFVFFAGISLWFAPTLKWKIMFVFASAIGIYLALIGKSMKGLTPIGRRI